ncbi:SpoIIE family protein phosphatase [Ureibacillus aquaedulcis]|uniref:MASE3 domain-containing protein n=1 Tax=Ureibacillus aquaedulcis TaxID=3058421 RepID=A0ABT8GPY5_9BACL|nr:SpoIIE family protein phosphatase [Ureibacillus sp. BA0131]MDN4492986.1 MASE3 domain-containing protein [Ureibacillus sp. BA0131]
MIAFIQRMAPHTRLLALVSILFFVLLNFQIDFFSELYQPIRHNHLALHAILEMVSIFVSITIALHGWVPFKETMSANWLLFSSVFLVVALLDLMHTFTFAGMPYFIIASNSQASIWFWVAARLTESIIFLIVILLPLKTRVKFSSGKYFYLFGLLYFLVVSFVIFRFYADLPLIIDNGHPTLLKNGFEYLAMIIHVAVLFKVIYGGSTMIYREIALASFYLILSSWLFTSYEEMNEYRNMAGHIFKVLGYYYLLRHMYYRKIEKPYADLHDLGARHELLLNSVAEGIYGINKEGKVTFINASALRMLGYERAEILGHDFHDLIHRTAEGSRFAKENCLTSQTALDGKSRNSKNQFFKRKDGLIFPVSMKTEPMLENGEQNGTVITFSDLSFELQFDELQREKRQFELELNLAVKLQESLNPQQMKWKDQEDVGAVSVPFRTLNGDFYTIVPRGNLLMMAIADISGKGIPAAIQKSMMVYALEDFNSRYEQPHDVLTSMNTFIHDYTSDYSFVTVTMVNYNKATRLFSYSTGGHEPILWYRAGCSELIELHTKNPALGIFEDSLYTTQSVELEPGDLIILYTDGVTECRNEDSPDGIELLWEALMRMDHTQPGDILAQQLLDEVNQLRPNEVHDDQTIIILKA